MKCIKCRKNDRHSIMNSRLREDGTLVLYTKEECRRIYETYLDMVKEYYNTSKEKQEQWRLKYGVTKENINQRAASTAWELWRERIYELGWNVN